MQKLIQICQGPFNSGLTADEMILFLGIGAKKVAPPHRTNAEDIKVVEIPINKLSSYLKRAEKRMKIDMKLFSIFYFLNEYFSNKKNNSFHRI